MRIKCLVAVLAFLLSCAASSAHAQLKDENLLVTLPGGFKVGFQDARNGVRLQEWVPTKESVENWSEMVTVQVFLNRGDIDPAKFLAGLAQRWGAACKGSTGEPVTTTRINGYVGATMLLHCPLSGETGRPETTLFRAIKGGDSFYLVQRAVRSVPSDDQLQRLRSYLATVSVCDTRSAAHPCPALKPMVK